MAWNPYLKIAGNHPKMIEGKIVERDIKHQNDLSESAFVNCRLVMVQHLLFSWLVNFLNRQNHLLKKMFTHKFS